MPSAPADLLGWLREQDWTDAYRRHRRNLQLIGLPDRERRWVLKNPSHLFALDALLAVYPDALVIQTHRSPRIAIASVCSLAAQASAGWSTTFSGAVIGSDQLELWASGLERSRRRGRGRPVAVLRRRLRGVRGRPGRHRGVGLPHFGLEMSGAAADAVRALASGGGDDCGRPTGTPCPISG